MSRELFGMELGVLITDENADSGAAIIKGTGAPGGDAGLQDAQGIGSLYLQDNGDIYMKIATGNVAADWERLARTSEVNAQTFKSLKAATGEALGAGARDLVASPFTDDDAPTMVAADFVIGDFILGGCGGTELLWEVTAIAAPSITLTAASPALATGDNFICANFLPDAPDSQENQSLLHYNGVDCIKLGDVDWDFADGINLTAGYAAVNGTISNADSVNSAIEKLDGNQKDLITLSGNAQGAVDNGTFTGTIITDNVTTKVALQELETQLGLAETTERSSALGVTAIAVVDSVLVDSVKACEWEVVVFEDATPANKRFAKVVAIHNGTPSADATLVDDSIFAKLKLGANFNLSLSVDINGAAGAQVMRLNAASTSAGVSVFARRTDVF